MGYAMNRSALIFTLTLLAGCSTLNSVDSPSDDRVVDVYGQLAESTTDLSASPATDGVVLGYSWSVPPEGFDYLAGTLLGADKKALCQREGTHLNWDVGVDGQAVRVEAYRFGDDYIGFNADYCQGAPLVWLYADTAATRAMDWLGTSPRSIVVTENGAFWLETLPGFLGVSDSSGPEVKTYGLFLYKGQHHMDVKIKGGPPVSAGAEIVLNPRLP